MNKFKYMTFSVTVIQALPPSISHISFSKALVQPLSILQPNELDKLHGQFHEQYLAPATGTEQ